MCDDCRLALAHHWKLSAIVSPKGVISRVPGAKLAVGAVLALLSTVLFAPTRAEAGCAHSSRSSTRSGAHFERLEQAGAIPQTGSEPARPEAPCRGAMCSQGPRLPLVPALAPPPFFDPWEGSIAALPIGETRECRPAIEGDSLHPVHGGPAPFHPPRS